MARRAFCDLHALQTKLEKLWRGMQGSNLRHSQSKCDVLPTELIPYCNNWWSLRASISPPPACKTGALPNELRSRKIGVLHRDRTRLGTLKGC